MEVNNMREAVEKFCTTIGLNPMLVQGAGGNISWKDHDTLWVKASGMWMADAKRKNIFVPVSLKEIRHEIEKCNFSMDIKTIELSDFRPSIETILHCLMPHKVVLHVHAVEILPYLVTNNYIGMLDSILDNTYNYAYVDYKKPGPDLAKAINDVFLNLPETQVIFLQNHGIVIGGVDVNEVNIILDFLESVMRDHTVIVNNLFRNITQDIPIDGYNAICDIKITKLIKDDINFFHTRENWALYPDHIVFWVDTHSVTTV